MTALAACGGSGSAPPAGAAPVAHVRLLHVPQGEAGVSLDAASRRLTVTISVTGLAPDSLHPARIGSGSCAAPERTLYPLSPVSANPTGMAADRVSTVSRPAGDRIPAAGWFIDLRNGPGTVSPAENLPLACGDVVNPAGGAEVTVPLSAPPRVVDQAAEGSADIAPDGGGLTVTVRARGLAPRSAHAAQLHLGSCEAEAEALHELNELRADAGGGAVGTTRIDGASLPARPTYVVVRRSTGGASQADTDPILCGNVGAAS